GVAHAVFDVGDDSRGDLVSGVGVEIGVIEEWVAVPARAHHDLQAGRRRYVPKLSRITAHTIAGDIAERAPSGVDEPPQLDLRESLVLHESVAPVFQHVVEENM